MKPYRLKASGRNTVPKTKLVPVQKDPVEVYCRIRPTNNQNDVVCLRAQSDTTVQLFPPDSFQRNRELVVPEYTFRYVFNENSLQKDIFERTALPLVEDLVNGKNALLFTYGVTSSGKTYTLSGTPTACGILPRSLDVVFNSILNHQAEKYIFKPSKYNGFEVQSLADALIEQQKDMCMKTPKGSRRRNQLEWSQRDTDEHQIDVDSPNHVFSVFISYVEIYNNYIYDLLETCTFEQNKGKGPQSKILREDPDRNMFVFDATEVEVKSAEEAFDAFWRGQLRRKVAHTALNTESSRSHSVFNMRIVRGSWNLLKDNVDLSVPLVISQLSLVDLAGSERTGRTRNAGNRLKEAGNINNSLMVLRLCIEILREKQLNPIVSALKLVPYRDNKLTHLFKSFFEGEGRVRMIVCTNPGIDEFDETLQAMKFAEMTQEVLIPRQVVPRQTMVPKIKSSSVSQDTILLTLGPPFPDISVMNPEDSHYLKSIEQYLLTRINYKTLAKEALHEKQSAFRENLVQMQADTNFLKQQVRTQQMDLSHRVEQLAAMERKWAGAEQTIDSLQRKVTELERAKRTLQGQLREKDHRINTGKVTQLQMQSELKDQLEMERDRMRRLMERRLAVKEAELQAKMCLSEEKIRMLRDILNSGDDWQLDEVAYPMGNQLVASTSEPQLTQMGMAQRVPKPKEVVSRSDPKLAMSKTPGRLPAGIPAANPRHRRSASVGSEKWVDHCPQGTVEMGTIFQPKMKKRKSVTRLESKDVVEASKYVLTHQEQEPGSKDVQTQLFKGNVVPSAGGGAQVIFDEVEVLQQTSPPHGYTLRKRSAEKTEPKTFYGPALEHKAPGLLKKPRH